MKFRPLMQPGLDKLRLLVVKELLPKPKQLSMVRTIEELKAEYLIQNRSSQHKAFKHRYSVPLQDYDNLEVELCPHKTDYPYSATLEWNPNHLGPEGSVKLKEFLQAFFGSDIDLLSKVLVQRVDAAVDFAVHISSIAAESRYAHKGTVWGREFNGKGHMETMYIGPMEDSHLLVYDKHVEEGSKLGGGSANRKKADYDAVIRQAITREKKKMPGRTRVERKYVLRNPVPLHRLGDIPPPFQGIHLYAFDDAKALAKTTSQRLLIALAKVVGLNTALKHLPQDERKAHRDWLADAHVEWWEPGKYTTSLKDLLSALDLFDPDAFKKSEQRGTQIDLIYKARRRALKSKPKPTTEGVN